MVLPNYKFAKGDRGINESSFGVKIRGSEPNNDNDNDNSPYVRKLFFNNEKDYVLSIMSKLRELIANKLEEDPIV